MAVVIPYVPNPTWADGAGGATPISAAKLNIIEDGIKDAHAMPSARVFHNANQSINNATVTALALNSERFDSDTIHDTVTNNSRLTCKHAGRYVISATVEWATNVTGERGCWIRHQGTTDIAGDRKPAGVAGAIQHSVTTIYELQINEYVEVTVYQTSGAGLNVVATGNRSPEFTMVRVA